MRLPVLAGLMALTVVSEASHAQDSLYFAGGEWSRIGSYTYLGSLMPIGGGSLGNGWVLRQWLDRLTYDYRGATTSIRAEDYGYSPAIGFQSAVLGSKVGLYGAVRIAHTSLDPDDSANTDRGTHGRVSLQGETFTPVAAHGLNQLLAQFEIGNGGYFVRDRLSFHGPGHYDMGPEIILKGNREYRARQYGLTFGGIAFGRRTTALLHAGVADQHGQSIAGYGSIEFLFRH